MITPTELHDLLQNDAPGAVNSHVDVSKRLYAIGKIEEDIASLKASRTEHMEFFRKREASLQDAIDFLKNQILSYMSMTEQNKIPLPNGTVSRTQRTSVHWPNTSILVEWCKKTGLPLRVKEEPDKNAIIEFIKETGNIPPGYDTESRESLSIRSATRGDGAQDDAQLDEFSLLS